MVSRPLVVLFGGNGFLGRHTAQLLLAQEYRVRVVSRRANTTIDEDKNIEYVSADALDANVVGHVVRGADAVVNFIGILSPDNRQSFYQAHKQIAETIAVACRDNNIPCLVHLSAIGADRESKSLYARSKAEGEVAVLGVMPDAVILRPSIIFGAQDNFFNRFAAMARFMPVLPLIGGGKTLFQPVCVDDVALAVLAILEGRSNKGVIYELGGERQYSFADLLQFLCQTIKKKRLLLGLPFPLAHFVAWSMEAANSISGGRVPEILMITRDQVELLRYDNVVSSEALAEGRSLHSLGIKPRALSPIVESYLCN